MGAERLASKGEDGRQADRHDVLIGVKLRRAGETWFASRIVDLTLEGFRLQSFVKLEAGMELWIMLPGFEGRRATIIWALNHEAGCSFERPLHPAILDHILKTARATSHDPG
jgi:hypothetical protein